jgi:hypothetical protein
MINSNIIEEYQKEYKIWMSTKTDYESLTEEQKLFYKLAKDKMNEINIKQINLLEHILFQISENMVLFRHYNNSLIKSIASSTL